MNILFFGSGPFGLPSLDWLAAGPHRLRGVVTAPPRPAGRGLEARPTAVFDWAQKRGVRAAEWGDGPAPIEAIRHFNADAFVVIDFGRLLPLELLELPKIAVNVHGSLLPRHRGAAPVPWAILSGDAETGVSVIRLSPRLDAGDLVALRRTPIGPDEDSGALEERLARLGAEALAEALDVVESGRASFVPQDEKKATHARKLKKEDGKIDWHEPAVQIARRVRAMRPWPVAYAFHEGRRVLLWDAAAESRKGSGAPGTILEADAATGRLAIAAGNGAIVLKRIQVEGKRPLDAAEFLAGARWKTGALLE